MVFNTLNKTFSLQNLCAEICCFSLRWSPASFHALRWSWCKQLTQLESKLENTVLFFSHRAAGEMLCHSATVTARLRSSGSQLCLSPARPWALCSGHPRAPTCQCTAPRMELAPSCRLWLPGQAPALI